MKKTPRMTLDNFWRGWVKPILIVVVVMSSFRSAVADWNDVPTGSMKPSILEGERIFVNKLAYDLKVPFTTWRIVDWSKPERGDVVVFYSPADGDRLVKRVISLPGDRIELRAERLFVNGAPAAYEPLDAARLSQIEAHRSSFPGRKGFAAERVGAHAHPVMVTPDVPAPRDFGPVIVPEGHYFVMGDNRDNSRDSRSFGPVPMRQIVGRASAVVFSVDPEHYYKPRWDRFFTALP